MDILLIEPTRDDLRMFSYNIMRLSARQVVAAHGYPDEPRKGDPIEGLPKPAEDCHVFHAGTKLDGKNVVLTRWTANPGNPGDTTQQRGVREACAAVSGTAVRDFMTKYPATDAPEPNAG